MNKIYRFLIPLMMFTLSWSIYGLDENPVWMRALGGSVTTFPAQGPNGDIYVVAGDRALHSLNPETGELNWTYRPGGKLRSLLLVGPDGTIYVQNQQQELYAITPGGTARWKINMHVELAVLPACAPDGRLLLPLVGGRIMCISRHGKILWTQNVGFNASAEPIVDGYGNVWIALKDGTILGLDSMGNAVRRFSEAGLVSVAVFDKTQRIWTGGPLGQVAVFLLDNVYSKVFVIQPHTSPVTSILTGQEEGVRIFYSDGTMLVLTPEGTEVRRENMRIDGMPLEAEDGTVFFPASDGSIHVIDPQGNATNIRGRSTLTAPLLTQDGMLIACSRDWILYGWKAMEPGIGWNQFRGGPQRSGVYSIESTTIDRERARQDTGFLIRERRARSRDFDEGAALLDELESFANSKAMHIEMPWVALLLEDLASQGTLRRVNNDAQVSHALIRERTYRLLGESEDFRVREFLLKCLKNENDSRALAAGFRALGRLGVDWDGASVRFIAQTYRRMQGAGDLIILEIVQTLSDLVRYNGGFFDEVGYTLMSELLSDAQNPEIRKSIFTIVRRLAML